MTPSTVRAALREGFRQAKPSRPTQLRYTVPIIRSTGTATRTSGSKAREFGRSMSFRASSSSIDRHGTIIRPLGIDTTKFSRNPIFAWSHGVYGSTFGGVPDIDAVIGKVTSWRKSKDSFDITVEFAPASINPKAETAFNMAKAGFLNAVSIGFVPLESHEERINGRSVQVFDAVELLEISLVPIPSNPDALMEGRSYYGSTRYSGKHDTAAAIRKAFRIARNTPPKVLSVKLDKTERKIRDMEAKLFADKWGKRVVNALVTGCTLSRHQRLNKFSERMRGVRSW